ncbi:MAG: phosphatase PAP2 family protein [Planctomycetota bacterium]
MERLQFLHGVLKRFRAKIKSLWIRTQAHVFTNEAEKNQSCKFLIEYQLSFDLGLHRHSDVDRLPKLATWADIDRTSLSLHWTIRVSRDGEKMTYTRRIPLAVCILFGMLAVYPADSANAQNRGRNDRFSKAQKLGYLGETSRSAMARNVLDRLKNQSTVRPANDQTDRVLLWHEIMLDTVAIDHTPDPDTGDVDFAHGGPTRTSRALAMVQIAVFDAVNTFENRFTAYTFSGRAPRSASLDAAIAYASYTTQIALFPNQAERLNSLLDSDLDQMRGSRQEIEDGRRIGQQAAAAIIDLRTGDNSDHSEPDWGEGGLVADGAASWDGSIINSGGNGVFQWEPDPLTPSDSGDGTLALGAYWGVVKTFSLSSGHQYRCPPPPRPGSREYVDGYQMVKSMGASPETVGSLSNPITRFFGNYWGYDATPLLGTPPRCYNQIAVQVATVEGINSPDEMARYLAMVNTALADSGIAAWDSKYFYNYWRPVTGIRRSDGVDATSTDENWEPVGISVINTEVAIRPTPPFPAYPSGHSTFGASTFEVMRQFFGNNTRFTFISDEYNGEGEDPFGIPRPLVPVRFQTLDEAQDSNGVSRIYNGVHWQWDNIAGLDLGEKIGRHVVFAGRAFQPTDRRQPNNQGGRRNGRR